MSIKGRFPQHLTSLSLLYVLIISITMYDACSQSNPGDNLKRKRERPIMGNTSKSCELCIHFKFGLQIDT